MAKTAKKPRGGRPPRHRDERLRKIRSFRIRPSLDRALLVAAEQSGRSVSEEIERALDTALDTNALLNLLGADLAANDIRMFLGYVARVMMLRQFAGWADETQRRALTFAIGLLFDTIARRGELTIDHLNAALDALPPELTNESRDAVRDFGLAAYIVVNPREQWARPAPPYLQEIKSD
jgi:hypothetical protein